MTIKVVLEGYIVVPPEDLAAVQAELPNHIALTRAEVGCEAFEVVVRQDDPHVFEVRERFATQAAFAEHQARVRASVWGKVTENVARHYAIREVDWPQ